MPPARLRCSASRGRARRTTPPSSSRSRARCSAAAGRSPCASSRRGVTVRARPEITLARSAADQHAGLADRRTICSPRPTRSPISACASAASPCARRTASCASASSSSRPIRRVARRPPAPSWSPRDGQVVGALVRQGRHRTSAARRDGGAARHLPAARRGDRRRRPRRARRRKTIDAALATVGPLSLGSLMLGVSRGGSTTPQLEFGAEPTAIAYFDIYGGAPGLPLSARARSRARPRRPGARHRCRSR